MNHEAFKTADLLKTETIRISPKRIYQLSLNNLNFQFKPRDSRREREIERERTKQIILHS